MNKNMGRQKISNRRINEAGFKPNPEDIAYGEIGVNYIKDGEELLIKNDNDEIVSFSPKTKFEDILNKPTTLEGYGIQDTPLIENAGTFSETDLTGITINSGVLSNDNKLYFCTNDGVWLLNDKTNTFTKIPENKSEGKGFHTMVNGENLKISVGGLSANKTLFFGAVGYSGIWMLDETNNEIVQTTKVDGSFNCAFYHDGILYFGGNQGVWVVNENDIIVPTNNTTSNINCVGLSSSRTLYFGGDGEAFRLKPNNPMEIEKLTINGEVGNFNTIGLDSNGLLYLGTTSGLYKVNSPSDITQLEETGGEPVKNVSFNCMALSTEGVLYFGTNKGVYKVHDETGNIEVVGNISEDLNFLSIHLHVDDLLYFGTNQGIFKLNTKTDELSETNITSGIFKNITSSYYDILFAGGDSGLYRYIDFNRNVYGRQYDKWVPLQTALGTSIYHGDEEPDNTSLFWVSPDNENQKPIDGADIYENKILKELRKEVENIKLDLDKINYSFNLKMDSGGPDYYAGSEFEDIDGIEPPFAPDNVEMGGIGKFSLLSEGDEEETVKETEPEYANEYEPNVKHLCIKRGKFESFSKYTLLDGELFYVKDKNLLYIGNDGNKKLVGSSSTGGDEEEESGINIDEAIPYLTFESENGTNFRLKIKDDGTLDFYNEIIDTADDQPIIQQNAECLKGLFISSVFAGPEGATAESYNIVSHSYIELYNSTIQDINLKGCSIQWGTTSQNWGVQELRGIIPAGSCFLIRCNPISEIEANTTLVHIDKYDMDCPNIVIDNRGFKIYLCIGRESVNVLNPWSTTGFANGYIDLVGVKNLDVTKSLDINAFENKIPSILTDTRGITRLHLADYNKAGFGDSNNSSKDLQAVDFARDVDIANTIEVYKPYCSEDGIKTMFYNRTKWYKDKPSMPTFSLGRDQTTRTFNWVSDGYRDEYLQYRKKGDTDWITLESFKTGNYKRRRIKGVDGTFFTVHKQIVKNFVEGDYEWRCGTDNFWTDIFNFTVVLPGETEFKFVQVSDQQGWTFSEYQPWKIALEKIIEEQNSNVNDKFPNGQDGIHFLVNTGDMAQNGNRPSEWLDYYNSGENILPNLAQINTVGNNDLCPLPGEKSGKVNPESFEYFYTFEYDDVNDVGTTQQINGEFMKSVYGFDYGCAHFVMLNSNNYIEEQKAWFKAHMAKVNAREVKPRWYIAIVHDAMFNITTNYAEDVKYGSGLRDSKMNQATEIDVEKRFSWSRLLEEYGFRLCLSGHKHTYSRTWALKETIVDPSSNGNNFPVNFMRPTYTTDASNGDGVTYVMTQSTGYKLQSNKDVPAVGIKWLAKYFPGTGSPLVSSMDQKAPTFIVWRVSRDTIKMETYQIKNLTNGATWDAWSSLGEDGGQAGVTDYGNFIVDEIDNLTLNWK